MVNLDPANDELPYECGIDIEDLVTLASVMDELKLGPNGGMMFCMEYLEKNMDWLKGKLAAYPGHYFLFDCPGQAELYTHHNAVKGVLAQIDKLGIRLATVHLIDSHHCTDPTKYVSALLLSLQTMLKLELPHVNVLSKIDLVEQYGRLGTSSFLSPYPPNSPFFFFCLDLAFDIEYYSEVMDLEYLVQMLDNDVFGKKYHGLNKALCELVEDFNLVGFATLNIEDKESILDLLKVIDKANGYMYGYKDEAKAQYMAPTQEKSDPSLYRLFYLFMNSFDWTSLAV